MKKEIQFLLYAGCVLFVLFINIFVSAENIINQDKKMSVVIPNTLHEKILYSTTKITTEKSSGTGFFYTKFIGNKKADFLVTNKHVLEGAKQISIKLHIKDDNNNPSKDSLNIIFAYDAKQWICHELADLCAFPILGIFEDLKNKTGKVPFYISIDNSILPKEDDLKTISVGGQVFMVGYPIGISDELNNYPLIRTGIFSTPPSISL